MTTAAFTALLWSALAGLDGTAVDLQAGGRAQTSTRAYFGDGSAAREAAVDLLPRISLLLDHKTLRLTLRYEPQLRATRDLAGAGLDTRISHGGNARAEWDVDRIWRVSAGARASVRLMDFTAPLGGEIPRLLDVRQPATYRQLDLGMSAGVEGRPTPRVAVASSVDVDSSGGVGDDGRAAAPLLQKLRLAGSVAREQTRADVLRVDASAVGAAFEGGGTASVATVTGGWARQAAPRLRLRLAGGASGARTGSDRSRLVPEAETAVEFTPAFLGGPLRAAAAIRAGAAVDRWTESVEERLGVEGALGWSPVPRWSIGTAAAWQVDRDRPRVSASRGDLRAGWRASPRVTVSGGVWNERQRDPALAAGTLSYWGATIGLDLAPNARL